MKIRKDFVTNSSSSSFVISKNCGDDILSYLEEDMLETFPPLVTPGSKYYSEYDDEPSFFIVEDDNNYYLYTSMDNSYLREYLDDHIPGYRSNYQDDFYCAATWVKEVYNIDIGDMWSSYINEEISEIMEEDSE